MKHSKKSLKTGFTLLGFTRMRYFSLFLDHYGISLEGMASGVYSIPEAEEAVEEVEWPVDFNGELMRYLDYRTGRHTARSAHISFMTACLACAQETGCKFFTIIKDETLDFIIERAERQGQELMASFSK